MARVMPIETGSYGSSQLGRLIFMGMDEVMGRAGVNAVMNRAGLPSLSDAYLDYRGDAPISLHQLSSALAALQQLYGLRSGQGLALQTGRAAFNYGMRDFGEGLGLLRQDYRLLPPLAKVRVGLKRLATFLSEIGSGEIRIEETAGRFIWLMERCPLCWQSQQDGPACHLWVGFLQEYLVWASGGKLFNVFEKECVACGAPACRIVIDQQALVD